MSDFKGTVEIREPFESYAWPNAWFWCEAVRNQFADDFFPSTLAQFVEQYSVRFGNARTFGLWKNKVLAGIVVLEPQSPVVATAHILLSKRLWGVPASELRRVAE